MSTSGQLSDGIVWAHANRDGHHSTVFRIVRVLSQFGYSVVAIVLCTSQALAAPLFDDYAVLDVTLTGPVFSVISNKDRREELPFSLTSGDATQPVAVRVRGQSRLQVCEFPPLRLRMVKAAAVVAEFEGQKKLKLVTHCRRQGQGEQDMLEEYAAYRIFNVLTDASYRVRLLRINYADTDEKLKEETAVRYAFLLEPDKQLANRLGATVAKRSGVPKTRHDRASAALVFVFQYLIGNTDWGLVTAEYSDTCCHNVKLLERDSQLFFVPFDFDRSGLVNARYASPDPTLRIKRVTQRLYRGLCTDREYLQDALQTITSRQADILAALRDIPGLAASSQVTADKFLNAFFEKAADEDKLLRSFERRCL